MDLKRTETVISRGHSSSPNEISEVSARFPATSGQQEKREESVNI